MSDARGVLAGRWWQALFPGLAIMITVLCLNILSEGITTPWPQPPRPRSAADDALAANREADKMVADPTLAYAAQAEMLEKRLAQLQAGKTHRPLRGAHGRAAHPGGQDLCIKFPRHGDVNVVDM
ncbi:MAG: hypothetical protein ACLVKI_10675 [Gordonibacter urolithinfaciens]